MKKQHISLFIVLLILLSTTIVSGEANIVDVPENVTFVAGSFHIPINITYTGKEIKIVFIANTPEYISVSYSPNPLYTSTNTQVTMWINSSINLSPGNYILETTYEIFEEEKSTYKGTVYTGSTPTESEKTPTIPTQKEDPVLEPDQEETNGETQDNFPIVPLVGLLIALLFIVLVILWRRKKGEKE